MDILPFDRIPGLTPEDISTLRKLRYSDEGRLLLRVLTECPPTSVTAIGNVGALEKHDHSYLLGRRECYDHVIQAFRLIGVAPLAPPPARDARYSKPKSTPTKPPEKADAS